MEESLVVFLVVILHQTVSENFRLCDNDTIPTNCHSQMWGAHTFNDTGKCELEYINPDSTDCVDSFSSIPVMSNTRLGQIRIKPFVLHLHCQTYTINHTIPNIVFRDIKWKKLKFRITKLGSWPTKRHCRSLVISKSMKIDASSDHNETRSLLHYDCYKSLTDGSYNGLTHVLDLEATDGTIVDGRQFLFFIPSVRMLSPNVNETLWKPFVYVENLVTRMQLYIVPPPAQKNFTYRVAVVKTCDNCSDDVIKNVTVVKHTDDEELTVDFTPTIDGLYYFAVTTLYEQCAIKNDCQTVKSPVVPLGEKTSIKLIYGVCFVVVPLIVFSLVVYMLYRKFYRGLPEIPKPPKVLVIYPSANIAHWECVESFVDYLRSDYGFDIMYDGDIASTTHCDPYFWAEDVISQATHVIYIVGPKEVNEENSNVLFQNVDQLLLSLLKAIRALQHKEVINVLFEHSDGPIPNETRNDRVFYLLNDWQKLIAYLSRDLLPKKQIMRTNTGRSFVENLTRIKKALNAPSLA